MSKISFLIYIYLKARKKPSVLSTFVVLSSIADSIMDEGCRQSSVSMRGVDKYKGKGTFKVNEAGKYEVEELDKFRNSFW